jgi:succinate dehydrogenase / fumarate reductase cytochrome b subunit
MRLLNSSVGRKIIMAITGQLMVLFVVVHLLGNSSIFLGAGALNSYAEHLHSLGPLVWVFRLAMLTFLVLHGWFGIQLTLENKNATPSGYAVNRKLKAGFASENMIWTGLILLGFIVYHLLHFTVRIDPEVVAAAGGITPGNVYAMVVTAFQHGITALIYVVAMLALFLHLSHGIQSFFQTMGWNNEKSLPVISTVGKVVAVVFLVGYSAIPLVILTGILTK